MVTLSRLFSSVLDLVYPPKCALCGQLGEKHALCTVCFDAFKPLEKQLSYSAIPSPLDYWASLYLYEGRAAQAVRLLKYKRVTSLAKPLSQLIWQGIQELGLTEVDGEDTLKEVLIRQSSCVPLFPKSFFFRSF
jgi:predicted amidophosphoribosyltransferase